MVLNDELKQLAAEYEQHPLPLYPTTVSDENERATTMLNDMVRSMKAAAIYGGHTLNWRVSTAGYTMDLKKCVEVFLSANGLAHIVNLVNYNDYDDVDMDEELERHQSNNWLHVVVKW